MVAAAGLRDRAAQFIMGPVNPIQLIGLAKELRSSEFPANQKRVVEQAFANLETAYRRMLDRYVGLQQDHDVDYLENIRDLFPDPDEVDDHPQELPASQQLVAPPNANQPLPPAPIETSLIERIWQAATEALQAFVDWILSAVFCMPPSSASVDPGPNIRTPQLPQNPRVNEGLPREGLIAPAVLPIQTFQGSTNWERAGGNGMSENCPYAFLVPFWDHLKREENVEGIPELIDRSIRDSVAMDQHAALNELFPRMRSFAIASVREDPKYLTLIDRLQVAAEISQQQMAAGVIHKGAESHLILVDLRIEGTPKYFYFNPHADQAYLQIFEVKNHWIEFIDRSINFDEQPIHRMDAIVVGDPQ